MSVPTNGHTNMPVYIYMYEHTTYRRSLLKKKVGEGTFEQAAPLHNCPDRSRKMMLLS